MSSPAGASLDDMVVLCCELLVNVLNRPGEGSGDTDLSEKVVVGVSLPAVLGGDDFVQPKKAPSLLGDFGRCLSDVSVFTDSSDSVLCTPLISSVI